MAEDGKKSKRYPVDISITFTIQLRNSSDSDLGRRPMPKSDEFSTCIAKGVEISALLYPKTLKKVIHFMGASPPAKWMRAHKMLGHKLRGEEKGLAKISGCPFLKSRT